MSNPCPTCSPSAWDCPIHAPKHMAAAQRPNGPIGTKPTGANTALEGAWEVARAVALIDKQLLSSDAVKAFAGLADTYARDAALWREVRPLLWAYANDGNDAVSHQEMELAKWLCGRGEELKEEL